MNYVERPCEKCKGPIRANEPYCQAPNCLSFKVFGIQEDPELGLLTYVEDHKYPMIGSPNQDKLDATAATKRVFIATLRLVFRLKLPLLCVLLPRKFLLKYLKMWIEEIYEADYKKRSIPDHHFSKCIREIIRTLIFLYGRAEWIFCVMLPFEIDMAYRYRLQDLLSLIDRNNINKNPRKEILRVLDIVLSREITNLSNSKMRLMKRAISLVLLSPMIRKEIKKFFNELDLEKVKPSINDKYWIAKRFDYLYDGKTYEERMKWREEEDRTWVRPEPVPARPNITLQANDEFYKLPPEEAAKLAYEAKLAVMNYYEKIRKPSENVL